MIKFIQNIYYRIKYSEWPPKDKYLRAIYFTLKRKNSNAVRMVGKRD